MILFWQIIVGWLLLGIVVGGVTIGVMARRAHFTSPSFTKFTKHVMEGGSGTPYDKSNTLYTITLVATLPLTLLALLWVCVVYTPLYVGWLVVKRSSALRGITAKLEGQ